jgi:hypothetical protein
MAFNYTPQFINSALTYSAYRQGINETLAQAPKDEVAEKMRHYIQKNELLMAQYDKDYKVSDLLKTAVEAAPFTTWLVITEGWCGDAAFNNPMLAAIEKLLPHKIKLLFVLRDSNLDFMDAHLTDGGRSIPKLIVLNDAMQELGYWGPRPAGLQILMAGWKGEGLELKHIIPKVKEWYDNDNTKSLQLELATLVKSYS